MKSEKRHELQKNVLAEWLGKQIEEIRPHLTMILAISLGVVACIVGWYIYSGNQSTASATAWTTYFSAFSEREPDAALKKVIETQQGNAAALWAKQSLADMKLAQGAPQMFSSRSDAEQNLAEAERIYNEILAAASEPMLLARARYGLARVTESQCKPEEARKIYEEVAKNQGDLALGQAAAKDAKRLSDERDAELLRWFAKQTPKPPPAMSSPFGGPFGPSNDLPSKPDISIPENFGLGPTGEGKIGESKIGETPAPAIGDKPLIEQKPEDRKPAEPGPEAKPDDIKPDNAKPAEPKVDAKPAESDK